MLRTVIAIDESTNAMFYGDILRIGQTESGVIFTSPGQESEGLHSILMLARHVPQFEAGEQVPALLDSQYVQIALA
jgi:hypothetical protein